MPLKGFNSLCKERQKEIVSRDKGSQIKHIAINQDEKKVTHYKIDGEVIKTGLRCDFLLMNEEEESRTAYLIELKGSDLLHAVEQLKSTKTLLEEQLKNYTVHFRIVLNRISTHDSMNKDFRKFQEINKGRVVYKTKILEEKI